MATTSRRLLVWTPRILGILVSLFIGIFALDAFSQGAPFLEALPDFLVHLIPSVVLLAVVGASWRSEWLAGLVFVGLALLVRADGKRSRRVDAPDLGSADGRRNAVPVELAPSPRASCVLNR